MAWTAPSTWVSGAILTAAQLNQQLRDNLTELAPFFASWTSWTPTVAQGATTNIAKTVSYAEYLVVGKLAIANCRLDITGTGTAGSGFTISVPSAITTSSTGPRLGGVHVFDSSTSTRYTGQAEWVTTTTLAAVGDWSGNGQWGSTPNLALANGDQIGFSIMYEIA